MTTPDTSKASALRDLDYIKSIAEEGRKAPLTGGPWAIMWGILLILVLLAHWAILTGKFGIDIKWLGANWAVYGIVGGIGSFILSRKYPRQPGETIGEKVEGAVWGYFLLAGIALFAGFMVAIIVNKAPYTIFDWTLPTAFFGYGIAYMTTATLSGHTRLRIPGILSILAIIGAVPLVGTAELYLYSAAVVLVVVLLPALTNLRGETPHA